MLKCSVQFDSLFRLPPFPLPPKKKPTPVRFFFLILHSPSNTTTNTTTPYSPLTCFVHAELACPATNRPGFN